MVEWLLSAGMLAGSVFLVVWAVRAIVQRGVTRLRSGMAASSFVFGLILFLLWSYELPFTFRTVVAAGLATATLLASLLRGRRRQQRA